MIARRLLLVTPALALVASCGPPPPAVVDLAIKASPDLNSSQADTPLSVAVRLYSLNDRGRFATADAYALMSRENAVLGDERAASEEIVVRPGETRKVTMAPKPGVRFLGVAVLFHDIDRAQWRAIAPIAASGTTRLVLAIGSNKAELGAA
ncbi:MAG: type VI secretion system lipoprotein TssJ [Croceibacterium sp.]